GQNELAPDQMREMLLRFGKGDEGKDDFFEQVLRKTVTDKNPDADKQQIDAAIKRLMVDKDFRDRMIDLAQKHKNQMPKNGQQPKLTPEEIEKLLKTLPDRGNGEDPLKVPEFDP